MTMRFFTFLGVFIYRRGHISAISKTEAEVCPLCMFKERATLSGFEPPTIIVEFFDNLQIKYLFGCLS